VVHPMDKDCAMERRKGVFSLSKYGRSLEQNGSCCLSGSTDACLEWIRFVAGLHAVVLAVVDAALESLVLCEDFISGTGRGR